MTKQDIVDLITAHYENDSRTFFQKTIKILKEFKENGDNGIFNTLDFLLKSTVKIAPKREEKPFEREISFADAEALGWTLVPQEDEITMKDDTEHPRSESKFGGYSLCEGMKHE